MVLSDSDFRWMARALALADRGRLGASPNPRVGCVLVRDGVEIGHGWHDQVGGPHAESAALSGLEASGVPTSGSTAYVSLEPCNHHGRTPPCTEALIRAGVARVVVGIGDPDPRVCGSGVAALRKAGIEVDVLPAHPEGRWANRRFLSSLERGRPWVVLKCAVSADGYADPPRGQGQRGSLPITSPVLRRLTHHWRAEEDAIIVGAGTVAIDDPLLDVREAVGRSPIPIVIDPQGRTDPGARVYLNPMATVVGGPHGLPAHVRRVQDDGDAIRAVLSHLQERGCRSVLVEGGAATLEAFLDSGLWDEARWCRSPRSTGGGLPAPHFPGAQEAVLRGEHPFGEDVVQYALKCDAAEWIGCAPPPTLHPTLPA